MILHLLNHVYIVLSVLKDKKMIIYMSEILGSTMNDNDKIELISNLDIPTSIDGWINLNMSDELKNYLLDRTSDSDYISFINDVFFFL